MMGSDVKWNPKTPRGPHPGYRLGVLILYLSRHLASQLPEDKASTTNDEGLGGLDVQIVGQWLKTTALGYSNFRASTLYQVFPA